MPRHVLWFIDALVSIRNSISTIDNTVEGDHNTTLVRLDLLGLMKRGIPPTSGSYSDTYDVKAYRGCSSINSTVCHVLYFPQS